MTFTCGFGALDGLKRIGRCRGMESQMSPLKRLILVSAAASLLGACQPVNPPDPFFKSASPVQLQDRVRMFCVRSQATIQKVSPTSVAQSCECYAKRTMKSFDKAELQFYRDTEKFNETGREKAFAALDKCNLKRP